MAPYLRGELPLRKFLTIQGQHVVVQSLSRVQFFVTPWTAARQAFLSFTVSQSLLKLMSIELLMPSNHLISLLSSPPPALNISQHQCLFK